MSDVGKQTLSMEGTSAVTGGALQTLALEDQELVINSANGDEANEINSMDALTIGGGGDPGTLTITGDQQLTLNDDIAFDNDEESTVDAEEFSAELSIDFERGDTTQNTQTVKLGDGDATVNMDLVGTSAGGDHNFQFEFTKESIADVTIDNFAAEGDGDVAGDDNADVLDFSVFSDWTVDFDDADGEDNTLNDLLGGLADGDSFTIVDSETGDELLDIERASNDVEVTAADEQFEGTVDLQGVEDNLNNASFDFANIA